MKALQHGSAAVFVSNDSEKPMEIEAEGSANDICAVWKRDIVEFRLPKVESAGSVRQLQQKRRQLQWKKRQLLQIKLSMLITQVGST